MRVERERERHDTNLYKWGDERRRRGRRRKSGRRRRKRGRIQDESSFEYSWGQLCSQRCRDGEASISVKKSIAASAAPEFRMMGLANNWSILIRSYVGHANAMEQWR